MLRCVLLGGFLIATHGFETDCGLDETDPCKVFSYDDLKNIEQNGLDRNYELMNDIHAPTDPAENFKPIGSSTSLEEYFSGTFNGNGHTIHNLLIGGEEAFPRKEYLALFGVLRGEAKICKLVLKDPIVSGARKNHRDTSQFCGALVGYMASTDARIEDVVIDNPNVSGYDEVGGLVGRVWGGSITRGHVRGGTVKVLLGRSSPYYSYGGHVGGLVAVAVSDARVKSSSAENVHVGSQDGLDLACGGLIGTLYGGGIADSFATGNVSCKTAGGLVGTFSIKSQISSSYSVFNLTAGVRPYTRLVQSKGLVGEVVVARRYQSLQSYDSLVANPMVKDSFAVSEITGVSKSKDDGEICVYDINHYGGLSFGLYCKNGPVVGSSPTSPTVQPPIMVESPDYFLHRENKPMIDWDNDSWTFEEGRHPSINKFFVDSGGPYKGNIVGKPVQLDRATASEGSYRWTVFKNSTICSFNDPSVLQPVLTCIGNDKLVVGVCLSAKKDKTRLRHCTRVTFEPAVVKCSISPCKKSAIVKTKRKNMGNILDSIRTQLNDLPKKYESISVTFRSLIDRLITKEARNNLVKGQITLAGIEQGKNELMRLLHRLEEDLIFKIISKEDHVGLERKIRRVLKEAGKLEIGCCDLPEE